MPFPNSCELARMTLETLGQWENFTGNEREWRATSARNHNLVDALLDTWPQEYIELFDQLEMLTGMNDAGGSFAADILMWRYAKLGGMPELQDIEDNFPLFSNDDLRAFRDAHTTRRGLDRY